MRPVVPAISSLDRPSATRATTLWLTRIGIHSHYAAAVLGPLLIAGLGFGLTIAPLMNTGTFGVAPQDAGVASAAMSLIQGYTTRFWAATAIFGAGAVICGAAAVICGALFRSRPLRASEPAAAAPGPARAKAVLQQ